MSRVRVIGVGSPFAADHLAWDVIDLLNQQEDLHDVECISLDRPGMALIEYFKDIEKVILLDAMQAGKQPGEIMHIDMNELEYQKQMHSSHGFGVAEALELAKTLGQLPDQLHILAMEIGSEEDWRPTDKDIEHMTETILLFILIH